MARWRKHLARMLSDAAPNDYTYNEAVAVLSALGFELAPSRGGSHRRWRKRLENGDVVVVGLIQSGSGTLKPYLIRDMLAQLRSNALIPLDLEAPHELDS